MESESASTIAIAKETLTRLANYRRIVLEEKVDVNESSVNSFLSLVSPIHRLDLYSRDERNLFVFIFSYDRFETSWSISYLWQEKCN